MQLAHVNVHIVSETGVALHNWDLVRSGSRQAHTPLFLQSSLKAGPWMCVSCWFTNHGYLSLQKLVLRVAKHQKQIGADILAVQDLHSRMSNAEVSLGSPT